MVENRKIYKVWGNRKVMVNGNLEGRVGDDTPHEVVKSKTFQKSLIKRITNHGVGCVILGVLFFLGLGVPVGLMVYDTKHRPVKKIDEEKYEVVEISKIISSFEKYDRRLVKIPEFSTGFIGYFSQETSFIYRLIITDEEQNVFRNSIQFSLYPQNRGYDSMHIQCHINSDKHDERFKVVNDILNKRGGRIISVSGLMMGTGNFYGHSIDIEDDNGVMQTYHLSDLFYNEGVRK